MSLLLVLTPRRVSKKTSKKRIESQAMASRIQLKPQRFKENLKKEDWKFRNVLLLRIYRSLFQRKPQKRGLKALPASGEGGRPGLFQRKPQKRGLKGILTRTIWPFLGLRFQRKPQKRGLKVKNLQDWVDNFFYSFKENLKKEDWKIISRNTLLSPFLSIVSKKTSKKRIER